MDKKTIKIVVFAGLRKYFGPETNISVDPEATYLSVIEALSHTNPEATQVLSSCRIAVNESFVALTQKIDASDTLYLIPPSSGG